MNPIFLEIGNIQIYWYSIFILIAFLVGGRIVLIEAKRFNISEGFIINLFFYLVTICLIGARLYYVLFNLDYYLINPQDIIKVWEGGLAIHGGIIFGLLFLLFYAHKYKVNIVRLLDIVVVGLIIGQAIGRWGNFFNSEAYGPVTTLSFLKSIHLPQFIIDGMNIDGFYRQPTFFYESIWCFIGFILLVVLRRTKYWKLGMCTSFYLIWYGVERFFVESLRTDSLMFMNFKVAQIASLLMVIIGIIWFILIKRKSVFNNRYNDIRNASGDSF